MASWLRDLDGLLRGQKTSPELLHEGRIDLPLRTFVPVAVVLGATYGFFMGWYAIGARGTDGLTQLVASMLKLPSLFLLTLVVTFPSLYVFSAMAGCRLGFIATLRLLVSAIVVNVAVAASLAPILGFFTLSTTSYPFMILLNVVLLGIAGVVALAFVLHSLRRLAPSPSWRTVYVDQRPPKTDASAATNPGESPSPASGGESAAGGHERSLASPRDLGPLDSAGGGTHDASLGPARFIFHVWVVTYGLVGAQMGWLLRPFIGSPDMPFNWFRHREGNVFQTIFAHLQTLLGN